eukprot:6016951-Amphidinium_carterae.1
MRLSRGQKLTLSHGDVISLTKPPALEDPYGANLWSEIPRKAQGSSKDELNLFLILRWRGHL